MMARPQLACLLVHPAYTVSVEGSTSRAARWQATATGAQLRLQRLQQMRALNAQVGLGTAWEEG